MTIKNTLHCVFYFLTLLLLPNIALANDDVFSIRTAYLSGENQKIIYTDSYRQATHLRVSPDGQWIMFTRYNDKDPKDGLAKENWGGKNHYDNTEIMLMRSDGSELRSIVPAQKNIISANSNWTEDGKSFVYLSTDNLKKRPELRRVYLNTKMQIQNTETIQLPDHLIPVDPHLYNGKLVFPAVDVRNMSRGLWIANADGSNVKKLTVPKDPDSGKLLKHPKSGDNDPRLSPDSSKVTFMRLIDGKELWSIYVIDLSNGKETQLTKQPFDNKRMDAVPEWSGDGNKLIFWTVDLKQVAFSITTIKPDGTERKTALHNPYLFFQSPSFFPNTGSDATSKIAFSVWKVPRWKIKLRRFLTP